MNIEDLIMNGATEEEIAAALKAVYEEKERREEALKKQTKDKEALKVEARAYLINAVLAYVEAFDLLDGKEVDEEDLKELEELIKMFEAVAPMYFKLYKDKLDIEDLLGDLFK